jgi:hypothetical protein
LARNEIICWVEDAKQETTGRAAFGGPGKQEDGQRPTLLLAGHRDRTGK